MKNDDFSDFAKKRRNYEEMIEEAYNSALERYGEMFYMQPGQFRLKKEGNCIYLEWSPGYDYSGMG